MSSKLPVLLTMLVLLPSTGEAQARANLTGTWTMVSERSESPAQTPPIHSLILTIDHSDTALDVTANRDGERATTSYPIEKTQTAAAGTIGAGTTRAYWEGPRLIAWRAGNVQGQTVSIKETFELDPGGSELRVESTVVIQHGYTMKGAKNYASLTDVFTKTP
jgi:hypothetical protein